MKPTCDNRRMPASATAAVPDALDCGGDWLYCYLTVAAASKSYCVFLCGVSMCRAAAAVVHPCASTVVPGWYESVHVLVVLECWAKLVYCMSWLVNNTSNRVGMEQ